MLKWIYRLRGYLDARRVREGSNKALFRFGVLARGLGPGWACKLARDRRITLAGESPRVVRTVDLTVILTGLALPFLATLLGYLQLSSVPVLLPFLLGNACGIDPGEERLTARKFTA